MKYKTWRIFHGVLAILIVSIAAWHVIDLGRHSSLAMSIFISILTAGGILLLLKSYTLKTSKKTSEG
jgi:predicted ferric reductase